MPDAPDSASSRSLAAIIDGYLTEVNVTSPTTVQEIDRLCNVRLEAQIVDFLEQRAPKKHDAA